MEEKIKSRLLLIGVSSMLLTWLCSMFAVYQSFDSRVKNEIKTSTHAIVLAYEQLSYEQRLEKLSFKDFRITVVKPDGNVVFDNVAHGKLENHLSRPEILAALKNGEGEDTRTSETLGYRTYYYAKEIEDGNILRVSMDVKNLNSSFDNFIPIFLIIGLIILLISLIMSKKLTKTIVKPIEELGENIDKIGENIPYKELKPFVKAVNLQQSKKRENEKIRQEFTANVSHELKTPLTSILGYAEMIDTGMAKNEDINEFAGKIHTEAERLITLIGDIIKLSELDEPVDKIRTFEMVDLCEISQEIKNMLEFNARQNCISIIVNGENPCEVFGDRVMLSELVYNLCDNAIKYNKQGGEVKITLSKDIQKVILSVKDTGIGISEKHQDRIFERFYRVDKSRSKQTGGTGLGLAIVKHIAIHHNAQISVFSEIDNGTQVSVVFNA